MARRPITDETAEPIAAEPEPVASDLIESAPELVAAETIVEQASPEKSQHPIEWARELGTKQHVYAGAAVIGAHRWIHGVSVTQAEYEATINAFLNIQIGG